MRFFISYRRDDAGQQAARVAERVRARFGPDAVFLDVEAIAAGEDFVEAIERAIWEADVVLVLIGPAWLDAVDAEGGRRLDDPRDYVRLEIEAASHRGVGTVPVLVGGALMPAAEELPDPLAPLARLNAVMLGDERLDQDLDSFLEELGAAAAATGGAVHLPAQPTPFIGRQAEVTAVLELLEGQGTRLLTLTGPGGAGKTRLSIEAASRLADRFPDGVWFVGLAALRDPELVVPTIATTLGLHEGFGSDLAETLGRFLRERRVLLVVDNLEQLLPEAAPVLGDLLDAAPELRMLASSREPLGIRAERLYSVAELTDADAAALFSDRARAADLRFDPEQHAQAIAAICDRLEGLPLGIELAAARVRLLSPAQLLKRLDERLPLLTGGARDAPDRQRTMRAAIAWSYDLLGPEDQELFAKLGVFHGGCTPEAAEAACGADLDALASLVDKSLLRTEERPRGEARFTMLETVREFAAERLKELPEADEVVDRYLEFFVRLAQEAELRSRSGDREPWFDRLDADLDNIRSVVSRCRRLPEPGTELGIVTALWRFWAARGYVAEGLEALDGAVVRSADPPPQARLGRCYLGSMAGANSAELLPDAQAVASACAAEGDRFGEVQALTLIGLLDGARGRMGEAEEPLNRAIAVSAGDFPAEEAEALGWLLIGALHGPSPVDSGIELCKRAIGREALDPSVRAFALVERAALEAMRGEFDIASTLLEEGRSAFRELDLKVFAANTAQEAFFVHMLADDPESAATELVAAYDELEGFGERGFLSTIAGDLVHVFYVLGNLPDAARYASLSQEAAADDDWMSQGLWRGGLAKVQARRGVVDHAIELADEAVRLMASTDFVNAHADRLTDLAEVLRIAERPDGSVHALRRARGLYEQKGNIIGIRRTEALLERSC
jgi:predicted ATPase